MKIGIDAREIQNGVITGIGRSLINLIGYFQKNDKKNCLILFSEKKIDFEFADNIRNVVLKPKISIFFWDQWILAKAIKAHQVDLFYSPYYKVPLLSGVPIVSQILDLMFLGFKQYKKSQSPLAKLYYSTCGRTYAMISKSIVTDSVHAKNDIIKFWKIEPSKVHVIPLGLADRYKEICDKQLLGEIKLRYDLPEKFILYLGNFKPHKNVKSLVRAFKKIEKIIPEYKLVLAGPLDQHGKTIRKFVADEGLEKRVIFTDTIRENDNPEALFTLATIFVFPTLYEGFGLPPLEAMACGTPVIASNLTSVPEVIGDSGILIDPLNLDEMSATIINLINNPTQRNYYSEKGLERSSKFKEEDTSGQLYAHLIDEVKGLI